MLLQPLLGWSIARACSGRVLRQVAGAGGGTDGAQRTYHRAAVGLRFFVFLSFAALFYLTTWAGVIGRATWLPEWSGLQQLAMVAPFFVSTLAVWLGLYPGDRALRECAVRARQWELGGAARVWSRGEYLVFNLRHQLLTVAAPMTLILVAWAVLTTFRREVTEVLRFSWSADALLGLAAAVVFLISPVLLKTIWSTEPLPAGRLRTRLEAACRRAGLRCRDILVWRSHGMLINAAVMGLMPRLRYVLLSDALLEGLDEDGIEAVFGHEAGHIRHHHIPYFLLFALVSVLVVSGVMEVLIRLSLGPDAVLKLGDLSIQVIGLVVVALFWGTVFGWLSRRFERQADAFGAQIASPSESCGEPCGVHTVENGEPRRSRDFQQGSGNTAEMEHAVCAGGARVFVSALDRVAVLNGIPHEEPSWRHSSIGSRMRFLTALAGDPALAAQFQRRILKIKRGLWAAALLGLVAGAGYTWWHPDYRELFYSRSVERIESAPASKSRPVPRRNPDLRPNARRDRAEKQR